MVDKLPSDDEKLKLDDEIITEVDQIMTNPFKRAKTKKKDDKKSILAKERKNPIWLSVSEAAKVGGIQNKTVRRAIKSHSIKYKIIGNRYLVDVASLIQFLHSTKKLENKLNEYGLGQYIEQWKK